jgi:hypothetical protein
MCGIIYRDALSKVPRLVYVRVPIVEASNRYWLLRCVFKPIGETCNSELATMWSRLAHRRDSICANISQYLRKSGLFTQISANICANRDYLRKPTTRSELDIQVLHIQCILFDELPAALHILAHQSRKNLFTGRNVFELHLQ